MKNDYLTVKVKIPKKIFMKSLSEEIESFYKSNPDFERVVRCENCKHSTKNGGDCRRYLTIWERDKDTNTKNQKIINLEFCSHGERIEENDNA